MIALILYICEILKILKCTTALFDIVDIFLLWPDRYVCMSNSSVYPGHYSQTIVAEEVWSW